MRLRIKHWTSRLVLVIATAVTLASCSQDDATGERLPDGKYPLTFTASVEGLTETRATGKDAWTVGDEIAVSTNADGSDSKIYKITDASTGAMTPDTDADQLYWQKSSNQPIVAWCPKEVTNADISDQSGGWGSFDYLVSNDTHNYNNNGANLSFKHAMAKVKCNLTFDYYSFFTQEEQNSAVVNINGYTTTSFHKGTAEGTGELGWISVYVAQGEYLWDTYHEALVVPQQMQGKKFIKVTTGADANAREYYYTPANATDAKLEAGKQYTYNITVKKNELVVTVKDNGGAWTDETTSTPAEAATFHVKCPNPNAKVTDFTIKEAGKDTPLEYNSGIGAYLVTTPTFTISYKLATSIPIYFRYLLDKGIGTIIDRSVTGDLITLTVSVRGDLEFSTDECTEVGDYYYNDGTWSNIWYSEKTCVGIVFHAGAGMGDDLSDYDGKLSNGIRGYVVSLKNNERAQWGAGGQTPIETSTNTTYFNGYANSKIISSAIGFNQSNYPAPYACLNYNQTSAGSGNSGWYMPSVGQLVVCAKARQAIESNLLKAGGEWLKNNFGYFGPSSSTWDDETYYYALNLDNPSPNSLEWGNAEYSRAILTF